MTIIQNSLSATQARGINSDLTGIAAGSPGAPADAGLPACTCPRGEQSGDAGNNVVELYPRASETVKYRARITASEAGMATAEYAIATLAAVGFAGLLVFILRSDEVRGFLLNLIRTALALP
ncbi:MAG TPA: DUF4244 domain-containing protein [Arthrobacter sp.]|nr:DUF4244 domain-containing protein [Arthrobacter sp.]